MKNNKKETKSHRPRLFLLLCLSTLIVIVFTNIIAFFAIDADQFNLFHKYEKIYRLETWNIPNNVDADINGDGVEDRISWTGCLFLSGTLDKAIVSKQYDCHDKQANGISVFNIEKSFFPQVRLSYIGKTNSNKWDIILTRNLHTELFNITVKGEVIQGNAPISLKADTVIYFITHLFVLITGM